MDIKWQGTVLECRQGNIADQPDIEAIVNAANADLVIGGGVAGAIHKAAGPELTEAGKELAPIKPGEAVITKAFHLPNSYVIHCLGPVYGKDKPAEKLLRDCYRNALQLAEENQIESVAFPAISTGAFGYPLEQAASAAVSEIVEQVTHGKYVKKIRFVLFSEKDFEMYLALLRQK
ncbi:macro domain-containing protein [Alteribacillus sp. HJP-4]|uniref:macro domain-containing protein n=1 Tax=Alteribacillus sp. HJP-4 TaxID=2775394 RepID=UPI0035CD14D1